MKYLTSNFAFATSPPDQELDIKNIPQDKALKELKDHGSPCFIPVIQNQKVANIISKLLNYDDRGYEPEMIQTTPSFPTLRKEDCAIVGIEGHPGDESENELLWYKVKVK